MTATSLETSINTPRSQPAGRGNYALLMTEALLVDENNHSWVSVIAALGCQEYHAQRAQTWLQPGSPISLLGLSVICHWTLHRHPTTLRLLAFSCRKNHSVQDCAYTYSSVRLHNILIIVKKSNKTTSLLFTTSYSKHY